MADTAADDAPEAGAVAVYKRIFKEVLESRPSGMRLRLAHAMGKNRSFVSQISNPAYPVPIPVQHLNTIFDVCHFPPQAKAAFLRAYARAHPSRRATQGEQTRRRAHVVHLPDLGDAGGNPALVPILLRTGLRTLSVAPSMLGAVKAAIARTRLHE